MSFRPNRSRYNVAQKPTDQADARARFDYELRKFQGKLYDSVEECTFARGLEIRKQAGEIRAWTRQVRIALIVNAFRVKTMVVDFKIIELDWSEHFIEIKGVVTDEFRITWRLLHALKRNDPKFKYTVLQKGKPITLDD